jgi:hypothetical protein
MIVRLKRKGSEKFLERFSLPVDVTDRVKHRSLGSPIGNQASLGERPHGLETVVHLW